MPSQLYEHLFPTGLFIPHKHVYFNMVYKFEVSNLWLLNLSLATIGIMKGKEGEFATGKKLLSVFVTS